MLHTATQGPRICCLPIVIAAEAESPGLSAGEQSKACGEDPVWRSGCRRNRCPFHARPLAQDSATPSASGSAKQSLISCSGKRRGCIWVDPPFSSATGLKNCTAKGPSSPQEEAFYLYHADASCKVAINTTFDFIFITGVLQAPSLPPLLCLRARAAAVQQTTFTFAFIKPCPFRGKRGELYIQRKINEISTLCK